MVAGQGWWRAGDTQVWVGNVVRDVLVALSARFMESQALHKAHSGLVWDQNQQLLLSSIVFNPDNNTAGFKLFSETSRA